MKIALLCALFAIVIFAPAFAGSACPGDVDLPFCSCQASAAGLARVDCRLDNETFPHDVFRRLNASGARIDSLMVTCQNYIEVLEPIPKFECRSLRISECGIQRVSERAFDALADSLEELVLARNQIFVFPFIKQLHRLKAINLNDNALKDIPERSFDGLESIRQIRAKNNQICLLSSNALNETKSTLELLDLAGNCLVAVPAQNIRNALALTNLNLAENRIGEITQMSAMNLPRLVELRLEANRLTRISPNAFMNVPELRILALDRNLLRKLDATSTLQAFKKLMRVTLDENQLVKSPVFKDMPELVEVSLAGNFIEKIDTLTFSGTPKLRVVRLQNNRIEVISRNSFDASDGMHTLILNNNSLKALEKTMFDGLRNLRFLALSQNAIATINANAFDALAALTVLELADNRVERLRAGTFAALTRLATLDLANNTNLAVFERGCFRSRISTIILNGIQLNCDEDFDWFVGYLVRHNVRTFVPNQPEIRCATPVKYSGHRLKDLMMAKANETIHGELISGQRGLTPTAAASESSGNILQSLLPAISGTHQYQGQLAHEGELNAAIEQFATGGGHADVGHLLKTLPSLVVNVPGFGNVDVSKLPPALIRHVLSGGDVPGIPRETLDKIVAQYAQRIRHAQPAPPGAFGEQPEERTRSYLPAQNAGIALSKRLPTPLLDGEQAVDAAQFSSFATEPVNISALISPKMLQMFRLLPRGFNLSEIPPDVIRAVQTGEMPDLTRLPPSLLQHFKDNLELVVETMNVGTQSSASIDELLKKLPRFDPIQASTFSPYDINDVDADLVVAQHEDASRAARAHFYAALGLALVAALSILMLAVFAYRLAVKRRNARDSARRAPLGGLAFDSGVSAHPRDASVSSFVSGKTVHY